MMQFFKPKLIECLRDYDRRTFFSDLAAGVTVGIVALPLAIGFGIASGLRQRKGCGLRSLPGGSSPRSVAAKCKSADRPARSFLFSPVSSRFMVTPVSH